MRLGEQTRLTLPYEGKAPFKVGSDYRLQRELDTPREQTCGVCDGTGHRKDLEPCKRCAGHGTRIYYERRVEAVEGPERILVLNRQKLRPSDITDEMALEEGWESADEWRDAFFATYGEAEFVWTFKFEVTTDIAQFPAQQNGLLHPPQYVKSPTRAIDDCEAPTAAEYWVWAEKAEAEQRRQREAQRLRDRAQELLNKADRLDRAA